MMTFNYSRLFRIMLTYHKSYSLQAYVISEELAFTSIYQLKECIQSKLAFLMKTNLTYILYVNELIQ